MKKETIAVSEPGVLVLFAPPFGSTATYIQLLAIVAGGAIRGFVNHVLSSGFLNTAPSPSVISPSISRFRISILLPKIAFA